MYGYDGQNFETFEEFLTYLYAKYGDLGAANHASISWWGEDLHGNYLFIDGVQQLGTEGEAMADAGFDEAAKVMQAYTQNPAQVSADTIAQLNKLKQTKEAVIQGSTYTNGTIPLGTEEAQGGQVLVATKPIASDNGTPFNAPKVMAEDAVEDPTVPGTFSYLATLKALGWLPLPTWTAAAAPLLGVGLGVALYDLNPDLWEKISRTLLPFCYDDNGTPKMPVTVDESGNMHTPEAALEALRNLLIEEGAYSTGDPSYDTDYDTSTYYDVNLSSVDDIMSLCAIAARERPGFTGFDTYKDNLRTVLESYAPCAVTVQSYQNSALNLNIRTGLQAGDKFKLASIRNNGTGGNITDFYRNGNVLSGYWKSNHYILINNNGLWVDPSGYALQTMTAGYYPIDSTYNWYSTLGMTPGGTGVEGATPESGAIYPTDTTKNLAEIYPTWAGNAINVVNNPTGTTIEDSTEKWYPISLANTNYSTDTANTSSTQTQTDAQSGTNTDSAQLNQIAQALQELTQTLTESGVLPENPTIPSDPSGDTPTPTPPVITGAGSDLIAIYNPTKTQLQQFNQFLWSLDPTNLTNWKKVFANPIDAIIALQMIYVTPITGETRNIKCGYIETDVPSKIVTNQYVDIDCGLVHLGEYFHNIWDYVATRVELYLPFIGIVPLHVGDVMESDIRVRYRVDVYTGTCLAQVIVLKGNSLATLYTYTGNCSVQLPVTSGQFAALWGALIAAGATAVTAGLGGAGLGAALGAGAKIGGKQLLHSGGANMQRSGGLGANAGAMGIRTPYLIINRNVPLDASMYQTQYGFPANKTVVLGNMNGYTRVKDIHLAGIPCTDDELEQIESLLKEGVIIN